MNSQANRNCTYVLSETLKTQTNRFIQLLTMSVYETIFFEFMFIIITIKNANALTYLLKSWVRRESPTWEEGEKHVYQ